jgi:predicted metal-dependent hydrolase
MSSLVVRRLLIDLEAPFDRQWNGGDAFRTAFFNALSMSFPVGEQFFIDSLRGGMKALPDEQRAAFQTEVQGFIGQEATHRRIHALFNAQLAQQGHRNTWETRAVERIKRLDAIPDPRHAVAATAATEHLTAILAEHLLEHPQTLEGAEQRLVTMWLWHASEESEHRNVAFDLYGALGGTNLWRRRWMRLVTWHFTTDVMRQTIRNLWHDGELLRWRTWKSGASFLFGRHGIVRLTFGRWRDYFRDDFHPSQQGGELGVAWLASHGETFRPVGAASAGA